MTTPKAPVILLGAGASYEAGLPLARQITGKMLDLLEAERGSLDPVLNYIVGTIVGFDSRNGTRPDVLPDVERVVSTVELLASRATLEVAPFVQWEPTVASFEASSKRSSWSLEHDVERVLGSRDPGGPASRIEEARQRSGPTAKKFIEAVMTIVDSRAGTATRPVYQELLLTLVSSLDKLLAIEDGASTAYLEPLVSLAERWPQLAVASLNYDMTLETAAERAGVSVSDGVGAWSHTGQLAFGRADICLHKLHGSLAWGREDGYGQGGLPAPHLIRREVGARNSRPFLVFGRREKLRAEGPFLQLLEHWRSCLAQTDTLIVIGYSFSDAHINGLLSQWANADSARSLIVVDPGFPGQRPDAGLPADFQVLLRRALNSMRPNGPMGAQVADSQRLWIVRQGAKQFLAGMGDDPVAHGKAVGTRK